MNKKKYNKKMNKKGKGILGSIANIASYTLGKIFDPFN